ncbi:MAG: cupin domain-containing protein [Nitrospirota bacterium]
MIDEIKHENKILGIIVRNDFHRPGISFFTPGEFSQQLAYLNYPAGKIIEPHIHNKTSREVLATKEVLILKKGKLQVDFYDDQQRYLESRILYAGDVILFAGGGHGFSVLEEIQMIEVKQGPYAGENDKTRFIGVSREQVNIKE